MKIQVSKLKHHPLNRKIYQMSDIDDLANSIVDVGLLSPLVIDDKNRVISGNRRLTALKQLQIKSVEVTRVKVSDKNVAQLLIHHNKQRVKSCTELLNEYHVLAKHYSVGQGKRTDLDSTFVNTDKGVNARAAIAGELGISNGKMAQILFVEKEDKTRIELIDCGLLTVNQAYLIVTREKNERESRKSRRGRPRKNTDDNFIFYKKSSDDMSEVQSESVQLVFTSPPYFNKRRYTNTNERWLGNEDSPDEYVTNLVNHFEDTYRVLKRKGSFFLNLGDSYMDRQLLCIPHRVAIGLQENGWILRNTIIWAKTNPKPSSSKNSLCSTYEYIFHFVKSKNYYYQHTLTPIKEDTKRKQSLAPRNPHYLFHKNATKKVQKSTSPYIARIEKNMGDFWTDDIVMTAVANQNGHRNLKEHPAPYPKDIIILPLLQTTRIDDLVLDPFHGSGTTGLVAREYNRRYVGYDRKHYQ